jgi:hypothetical protein
MNDVILKQAELSVCDERLQNMVTYICDHVTACVKCMLMYTHISIVGRIVWLLISKD